MNNNIASATTTINSNSAAPSPPTIAPIIPISTNKSTITPTTDQKPSFIIPSIIAYSKYNPIPASPAKPPIAKIPPIEVSNALNIDAKALKKTPRTKKIIANAADQKITNATKSSPPYSIVAEFILIDALLISSSVI